jgi:hypothetical protein
MSTAERSWATGLQFGFFWTGIFLTLACIALVLASNTAVGYRLDHMGLPLPWVLGVGAVLQFVMAEICQRASPHASAPKSLDY